jgi:phenylalanyl-tRNA synthetase beta chain
MNVAAEESSALGLTGLVEIANPKLMTMTCLRNWLLPSLMAFLSSNKSVEFPQRIFELGKITVRATSVEVRTLDEDKIAAVVSHPTANFTEIKSMLDAFLMNMGIAWRIEPSFNPSFIEGRSGDVIVDDKIAGTLGEINPLVLASWNLENPAAAFEVDVGKLVHSKTQ